MDAAMWSRALFRGVVGTTLLLASGIARGDTPTAPAPAPRDTMPLEARAPERVKIGEPAIADPHRAPDRQHPDSDADVLGVLRETNRFEVAAGDLARRKGQSPAVKDFGAQLVRDHRDADEKVMSYARRHGVEPDRVADSGGLIARSRAEHDRQLAQLRATDGAAFDRAFSDMMVKGHERAIGLVTSADVSAIDPQLKALLQDLLPRLTEHEQMAQRVRDVVATHAAAPAPAP
jgi:putative membrane protein